MKKMNYLKMEKDLLRSVHMYEYLIPPKYIKLLLDHIRNIIVYGHEDNDITEAETYYSRALNILYKYILIDKNLDIHEYWIFNSFKDYEIEDGKHD
jgi:hypothetical protein